MTTSDSPGPKIGVGANSAQLSQLSQVMTHFVPNFVAIATGVNQG